MGRAATAPVYGVATLDCHGRIADRRVLRALGWTPGAGLELDGTRELITVRVGADGARVTPQGHVRLPARLRHRCSLAAGDRVLLVADPATATLIVVPPATLDGVVGRLLAGVDGREESESPTATGAAAGAAQARVGSGGVAR